MPRNNKQYLSPTVEQEYFKYAQLNNGLTFTEAIFNQQITDACFNFEVDITELYSKFKFADTSSEAQEYLEKMDELFESHKNLMMTLHTQVLKLSQECEQYKRVINMLSPPQE